MSRIIAVTTQTPKYKYTTEQIVEAADKMWFSKCESQIQKTALKIFKATEISERCAVVPLDVVFSDLTFRQKNDIYIENAIEMACEVTEKLLKEQGLKAKDVDYLITTSCTGFMIPSVDAFMINKLGFRKNVVRLPVTEMGCAGGVSGLIYAQQFLEANPTKTALVVSVEIPSITVQKNDLSLENIVSSAIFADGAAAVLLAGDKSEVVSKSKCGLRFLDSDMYHFSDSTHLMGYQLWDTGLKIVLDRDVPNAIQKEFSSIFFPLLEKNQLRVEDLRDVMIHPGGKKIINWVEDFFGKCSKDIRRSKGVLSDRGNMSSATILHILERHMKTPGQPGDIAYMLAFGPGFAALNILLKWE